MMFHNFWAVSEHRSLPKRSTLLKNLGLLGLLALSPIMELAS